MATMYWMGVNGDWNDPNNWAGGTVPTTADAVDFSSGSSVTVSGASYIGTLNVDGANVLLAGNFSGDGVNASALSDGAVSGSLGTLAVASWSSISVDTVSLNRTYLYIQGMLSDGAAEVANVGVDGTSAEWLSDDTQLTGTLALTNGGIVAGLIELGQGSAIICDSLSSLEDGTISATGDSQLCFDASAVSDTFSMADDIDVSSGATLSLMCPASSTANLNSEIIGPGTLELDGSYTLSGAQFSLSAHLNVVNGTLAIQNVAPGGGLLTLDDSLLDLSSDQTYTTGSLQVNCEGFGNSIVGGDGSVCVNAGTSSTLSFTAGEGPVTIYGGSATLSVSGGNGPDLIFCGTAGGSIQCGSGDDTVLAQSGTIHAVGGTGNDRIWGNSAGHDTIIGGTGNDTLVGGTGAQVYATGAGATYLGTYATVDGALLDASDSSGRDTLFAGGGAGVITLTGGSGDDIIVGGAGVDSITCGSGNTSVFAGTGVGDTIMGGSGADVLVGGPAANISIVGSAANGAVSMGMGTLVNASGSSGNDTVFAAGSGVTTILGGSGSECIVGTTSYMSVVGGSGALQVWGSAAGHDTILGGGGNDTLLASSYSDVVATGSGSNVLISQGTGSTLDASQVTGSTEYFLVGPPSASTNVLFGSGSNELVSAGQTAAITCEGGTGVIWAGFGGLNIVLPAPDISGTLDVYQFNSSASTITLSSEDYQESESGGNTQIVYGSETIVLHGVAGFASSNIIVK